MFDRSVSPLLVAAALGFALAVAPGTGFARPFDDTPCHDDANGVCGSQRPGKRPIRECLQRFAKRGKVTAACEAYITNYDAERKAAALRKRDEFWKNCEAEVQKHCQEHRKTAYNAMRCLGHRIDELDEKCVAHLPPTARGAQTTSGWVGVPDPSEPDEKYIARAEALRPGKGGEQARRRLMLRRMTPEERKEFLAKEREENAASRAEESKQLLEALNERSQQRKPKLTPEEKAAKKAKREAEQAARQEEWKKRREEWKARREAAAAQAMQAAGAEAANSDSGSATEDEAEDSE